MRANSSRSHTKADYCACTTGSVPRAGRLLLKETARIPEIFEALSLELKGYARPNAVNKADKMICYLAVMLAAGGTAPGSPSLLMRVSPPGLTPGGQVIEPG